MLSLEKPSPSAPERPAAVTRAFWCWPPLAAALAVVLDALGLRPWSHDAGGVLWMDVAAVLTLGWALLGTRRGRRGDWSTPVDGRVLAGIVLAALHVVQSGGRGEPVSWLHQIVSAGACFYALAARLRRESRAPDAVWPAFALVVLALSAHTLWSATTGLAGFEAATRAVDQRWSADHGLAKALALATVLCAGRASEPGARALWRVTALVGALASALHLVLGGAGLGVESLASLEDPFYFGTSVVAFLLLSGLARMAWQLVRERAEEAGRWRSAAVAFPFTVLLMLFGGTTGGEGLRLVAALAGAVVIAARNAPRAAGAKAPLTSGERPLARAA